MSSSEIISVNNVTIKSDVTYVTNWVYKGIRYNFTFDIRFRKIRPILDFIGICLNRRTLEFNKLVCIDFNDFYNLLLILYPDLANSYYYSDIRVAKEYFRNDISKWYALILDRLCTDCSNDDLVVEQEDFNLFIVSEHVYYKYLEDIVFVSNFIDSGLGYNLVTGNPSVTLNDDYCYIDLLINHQIGGLMFKEVYSTHKQRFLWLLYYFYETYSHNKDKFIPFKFYKLGTIYAIGEHQIRFVLECKVRDI